MTSADIHILLWLLIFFIYLILYKTDNPVKRWLKKYRSFVNVMIGVILLVLFNGQGVLSMFPIIFILLGLCYLYKDYKNLFGSHEAKS